MELGEYLTKYRKEAGMTIDELAIASGVPKGTINKIISGTTKSPTLDNVQALANALGKTLDDFTDRPQQSHSAETGTLSEEDQRLIAKYRALDKRGKEKVDTILNWETERLAELKRLQDSFKVESAEELTAALIRFPRSYQPASAGTGMFLGPDDFETIYVLDNPLTRRASFSVPISGDSMEPEYHDGDTLLIEAANDIRVGEIGVFTLDGQGYVKKRGENELISLNLEYEPIPMNESIRCNGRVIGVLKPEWIVEK